MGNCCFGRREDQSEELLMESYRELQQLLTSELVSEEEQRREQERMETRAARGFHRPGEPTDLCDEFTKYWNEYLVQKEKVVELITDCGYDRLIVLKRGRMEKAKYQEAIETADQAYSLFFDPNTTVGDQQLIEIIQMCAERMEEVLGSIRIFDDGIESSDDDDESGAQVEVLSVISEGASEMENDDKDSENDAIGED